MGSDFKDRLGKIFGALSPSSSSATTTEDHDAAAAVAWQVSHSEVERKQWRRPPPDESREEAPCAASFASGMFEKLRRRRHDFEEEQSDDVEDRDEEEEELAAEVDGLFMRSIVGRDCTLDREDEEDEYDKVAVGRENSDERTYMGDILNSGPKVNPHKVLPRSLYELKRISRDPRANHSAARARLREDEEEAFAQADTAKVQNSVNDDNSKEHTIPNSRIEPQESQFGKVGTVPTDLPSSREQDNINNKSDGSGDVIMQEAQPLERLDDLRSEMELRSIMELNLEEKDSDHRYRDHAIQSGITKVNDKKYGAGAEDSQMQEAENGSESEDSKSEINLRSILKRKPSEGESPNEANLEILPNGSDQTINSPLQKPKKRVRFEDGVRGDPAGQLVHRSMFTGNDIFGKGSVQSGDVSMQPSQSMHSSVPDYVKNPSKYIHYTLDWSDEDDDKINMQALNDFFKLRKKSEETTADEQKPSESPIPVTFIPRKKLESSEKLDKSLDSSLAIQNADKVNQKDSALGIRPIGIAVNQGTEGDPSEYVDAKIEVQQSDSENSMPKLPKGSRHYRSKSKSIEDSCD